MTTKTLGQRVHGDLPVIWLNRKQSKPLWLDTSTLPQLVLCGHLPEAAATCTACQRTARGSSVPRIGLD